MSRRRFLQLAGCAAVAAGGGHDARGLNSSPSPEAARSATTRDAQRNVTLFLAGDVMTGRGIDQVLPEPSHPEIFERYMKSARGYVELAETANGSIPPRVRFDYIWGDALAELDARAPARRIGNLETSVTTHSERWPKEINYRMHPRNVSCLQAAKFDCCTLANNHVLDWQVQGLHETVATLTGAGIAVAGAGRNIAEAARPAILELAGKTRLLVFSCGSPTSGIPEAWAATPSRPGVHFVPELSRASARELAGKISAEARAGDLVILSIHWGRNWGYEIPAEQREFAHELIDAGAAHIVHGHSSHHPKGIEVYRGRLILYGCGDFLNDYEGIGKHEEFRSTLVLAYFVTLETSGTLAELTMVPFRIVRFQLKRAKGGDTAWLERTLAREGKQLGTHVELSNEGALTLRW